ncbi:MAG: hypothetical protein IJX54_04125 [Oscillospiraceae bacterium]|nr:hypothetical protein [Oscillospiraceae bacterium]
MERKRDPLSIVGMIILALIIITIGIILIDNSGLVGGRNDLTYVTFVCEHNNGTVDTAIIGYKNDIVCEYTLETKYPTDVWSEDEIDGILEWYRETDKELKSEKCYKVKIKKSDKYVIASEIFTGLDKEENREALIDAGFNLTAEPLPYSVLESELLSNGFVKQ